MAQPTLTPRAFAQKWRDNETREKAASQGHFIDQRPTWQFTDTDAEQPCRNGAVYTIRPRIGEPTAGRCRLYTSRVGACTLAQWPDPRPAA